MEYLENAVPKPLSLGKDFWNTETVIDCRNKIEYDFVYRTFSKGLCVNSEVNASLCHLIIGQDTPLVNQWRRSGKLKDLATPSSVEEIAAFGESGLYREFYLFCAPTYPLCRRRISALLVVPHTSCSSRWDGWLEIIFFFLLRLWKWADASTLRFRFSPAACDANLRSKGRSPYCVDTVWLALIGTVIMKLNRAQADLSMAGRAWRHDLSTNSIAAHLLGT